ncbi:MAG: glycosyltransferase [Novosphingobium sp.]
MRILSISTLFPNRARPAFGRFVADQMAALARRDDIALTLVAPIGLPPWPLSMRAPYASLRAEPDVADWQGVTLYHPRFRTFPGLADSNPGRLARAVLPLVQRLHAQQPFDVIDAQFFFPDGPAAAIIAQSLGLPLSIKARGSDIHLWGQRPAARAQMVATSRQAAGILAVSEALKRDMVALGMPEERIGVHYTGLDRSRFYPIPRGEARAALGLDDAPLFVCPGALIAIKGQALAIEALAAVPAARLALAGSGPDEQMLRAWAEPLGLSDRVMFLGQIDHAVLMQWLCAADAMVLPSIREGLANVWIEALACGTPLVIPDIGGAREIVRDQSAGRIVDRTPQAVAAALSDLLANPPQQAQVARNAERFSWEENVGQLAAHFHRIAAR